MQITEEVQAEIMEIEADQIMKYAEPPTDTELDEMYAAQFDGDWAKERQFTDMHVERMLAPAPHHPQYFREDTAADHLADIQRGNVEASNTNH